VSALLFVVFFVMIFAGWRLLKTNKKKAVKVHYQPTLVVTNPSPVPPQNNSISPKGPSLLLRNFMLNYAADLTEEQQGQLSKFTAAIEQPAPLFSQLVGQTFEAKELFDLIKTDAKTSAKILANVNSSRYGLRHEITNINHAINYLGVISSTNIALSLCVGFNYKGWSEHQKRAYTKVILRARFASELTLYIAQQLRCEEFAKLSTVSLFCFIGDQTLIARNDKVARQYLNHKSLLEYVVSIQKKFGLNSAIIAHQLNCDWGVPSSISDQVKRSLSLLKLAEENSEPVTYDDAICYFSCRLSELILDNPKQSLEPLLANALINHDDFYAFAQLRGQAEYQPLFSFIDKPEFYRGVGALIKKNQIGGA